MDKAVEGVCAFRSRGGPNERCNRYIHQICWKHDSCISYLYILAVHAIFLRPYIIMKAFHCMSNSSPVSKPHKQAFNMVQNSSPGHRQLEIKFSKCSSAQQQTSYLGHIISSTRIVTDLSKVSASYLILAFPLVS